jgi:hypothetical protein
MRFAAPETATTHSWLSLDLNLDPDMSSYLHSQMEGRDSSGEGAEPREQQCIQAEGAAGGCDVFKGPPSQCGGCTVPLGLFGTYQRAIGGQCGAALCLLEV